MEKRIIIDFLEKSGFEKKGVDTYKRKETGTIFIREWNATKVMWQIMELGEKHHANKLRDLLKISEQVETYVFNPQV